MLSTCIVTMLFDPNTLYFLLYFQQVFLIYCIELINFKLIK